MMNNLEKDLRERLSVAKKNTKHIEQEIFIAKTALIKLVKDLEECQRYENELEYVINTVYSPPPGDFS